jgi:hypothetical protein
MNESRSAIILSFISVFVAIFSFTFAIYVHFNTEKKLSIYERPILKIFGNETVEKNIDEETKKLQYTFNYSIKNIGKHPADKLTVKAYYVLESTGKKLEKTVESVNRINLEDEISVLNPVSPTHEISKDNKVLIKIKLSYVDAITPNENQYTEIYWFTFKGSQFIRHSTVEEKEKMEGFL